MGLNEKVLFYNDERRMKETVRHMRKNLRVFHYFWVYPIIQRSKLCAEQ